jgi:hypothetical protein
MGDHMNQGKVAVLYGPLVLAADEELVDSSSLHGRENTENTAALPLNSVAVPGPKLELLKLRPEPAPGKLRSWPGEEVFRIQAVTRKPLGSLKPGAPLTLSLIPFAEAGGTGSRYKVWLPLPRSIYSGNLLLDAQESRSRHGNLGGSITDEDFQTAVVTYDGKAADEDWFAVQLDEPAAIKRVLFAHGKTFHDGGWFDATAGKPRIQVQKTKEGPWETVIEIKDYPPTTSRDSAEMDGGENFTCILPEPVRACAIRVIGKPACGDSPQQAFSSCAELQAFRE